MRRIVTWALSTVTVLVLLFSYHTSTSSTAAPTAQVAVRGSGTGGSPATGAASGGGPAGPVPGGSGAALGSAPAASSAQPVTVTGATAMTRFGPVQVQVTMAGGKITAADAVQVPNSQRRDVLINGQAVPILNQEAVAAQSARIDMVSGATYTSQGYAQSLQSAIDKAHQ